MIWPPQVVATSHGGSISEQGSGVQKSLIEVTSTALGPPDLLASCLGRFFCAFAALRRNNLAVCLAVSIITPAFLSSCTSPCGRKLQQHVFLSGVSQERDVLVPRCGGSAYRDFDLTRLGEIEVDISNPNAVGSGVDGYLTDVGCDRLFDAYSGLASLPLCAIHLGPVAPRTVSARKRVAPRRYRLFAQAWTANQSATFVSLDMGLWSTACKWNPISVKSTLCPVASLRRHCLV